MTPDAWQERVLRTSGNIQLLCSRQIGKSTVVAALIVITSLLKAPALILIVSPAERQSAELLLKVRQFYDTLMRAQNISGRVMLSVYEKMVEDAGLDSSYLKMPTKVRESALRLELDNGSRIIGLPGTEKTIRSFSGVSLIVFEEASRIPDELYYSLRPMLLTGGGRMVAPTTPFGKRGWFYKEWQENLDDWHKIKIPATDSPRALPTFLAAEKRILGDKWYAQEYECSFEAATGQLIPQDQIQAALDRGKSLPPEPFNF